MKSEKKSRGKAEATAAAAALISTNCSKSDQIRTVLVGFSLFHFV